MEKKFVCTADEPVVQSTAGKLRGFIYDGVYTFYGIKYADAERFQAPVPPAAWEGVQDAVNYGYVCPMSGNPAPKSELYIPHRFWPSNEHCQYLNIWSPTLEPGARKPVMVWFHGGGFSSGSSIEQVAYEGDSLAKREDVVVVTVNHRLNILGFLDMSSFGEKYRNSVNAGMADLVAALRWIRDNIAGFGGDPGNVTIFGQSGGGGKCEALLQIPEADGLFHKAIMMSGIMPPSSAKPVDHRVIIEEMLRELNIAPDRAEELETVPYELLDRVYNRAAEKLHTSIQWGPVANDWYLGDPLKVGFSEHAKKIPVIAGTVVAEFASRNELAAENAMTEEEKLAAVEKAFGEDAGDVLGAFRKSYPGEDLNLIGKVDMIFRPSTVEFIRKKAEVSCADAYLYVFAMKFDIKGGAYAWHCADIPFVFRNTARVPSAFVEGVTERLEDEMCGAWTSFAYTGNPNHPGLVRWDSYTEKTPVTMVFRRNSGALPDFDTELMALLRKHSNETAESLLAGMMKKVTKGKEKEWIY